MQKFVLKSDFSPKGDQSKAIKGLVDGLNRKYKDQTLLGVTGSGKTFTMAKIIESVQRPTLIISHNKTLAAQLYGEFKQFFPDNAIHYFVSYYDYYQPEAYIPQSDTYIEKEATINEEIDRLRHSATQSLLNRSDVLIVASVSCIYGLGDKASYKALSKVFKVGQKIKRNEILRQLIQIQYERNDKEFYRGKVRVRGEMIDIHLATGEAVVRILSYGDEIEKVLIFNIKPDIKNPIWALDLRSRDAIELEEVIVLPAKHFMTPEVRLKNALSKIRKELVLRLKQLKKQKKKLEAYRLEKKTNYDLEMIEEVGYCNGIENYSRHLSERKEGDPPETLMDFFPKDYLVFIDESHVTLPQVRGMYAGDQSRKQTLVDFGFRLPSAKDNRPLNFEEFNKKINQAIYVSATPNEYEIKNSVYKINYKENVVIIHGSSGRSKVNDLNYVVPNRRHWHGWLEDSLRDKKIDVFNPCMPNDWKPDYKEWEKIIKNKINQDTILVATSAGASFVLKWLSKNENIKIKKLIINAPSYLLAENEDSMKDLVNFKLDKKINNQIKDGTTVFISNDLEHRVKSAELISDKLGVKLIRLKDRGHFCISDNKSNKKFPELLLEIKKHLTKDNKTVFAVVEQVIRPTGLIDPEVDVRPKKNQIPDLIKEIKERVRNKQRVLITTLTKRMAEELTEYLVEYKMKVQYLHSEVKTLDRVDILRDLREGKYDVLVGINLLREGLDLPEVSLVVILDADIGGFLRHKTALIQTMGRAARHVDGKVIMYADKITLAMSFAISETKRRRKIQIAYNKKHKIIPKTIKAEFHESMIY
jgi:excinuclease UvrABC helicase subunit UvrB